MAEHTPQQESAIVEGGRIANSAVRVGAIGSMVGIIAGTLCGAGIVAGFYEGSGAHPLDAAVPLLIGLAVGLATGWLAYALAVFSSVRGHTEPGERAGPVTIAMFWSLLVVPGIWLVLACLFLLVGL